MDEKALILSRAQSIVIIERNSLVSRGLQLANRLAQHGTNIDQGEERISPDMSSQLFAERQYEVGLMYRYRESDSSDFMSDYDEAIRSFRGAAKLGHAGAQYELYMADYEGYDECVLQDERILWLRRAAEQGHARAQRNLGCIYLDGCDGILKNDTEAITWFRKAAVHGDSDAQYQLGLILYSCGEILSGEAESWLQQSAEQGHPGAQWKIDSIRGVATLAFTNTGRVYWRNPYELPHASRSSHGEANTSHHSLDPSETLVTLLPVSDFDEDKYIFMVTRSGVVKKTALQAFSNPRATGIIALELDKGDQLIYVQLTSGEDNILIATHGGMAIRFPEVDVRPMGRTARGVIGIRLDKGDYVVGVSLAKDDRTVLSVAENGFGKRTQVGEYRLQHRGGSGIINMKTTDKNGKVVAMLTVDDDDEIVVVATDGITTRIAVRTIQIISRNAQCVKMVTLSPGIGVSSVTREPHRAR